MTSNKVWRRLAVGVVALLLCAGVVSAQGVSTGNLYGTAGDEQGSPLPGVTVTLSGPGAPRVQVSDASGGFRFLGLDPGNYSIKAELEGFSPVEYPRVNIRVAVNTTLEVQMSAAVEEVITVTSESPLLDERVSRTGTTVTQVELEKIPTARDPWAILSQTPGVVVDRINVGGNESGQQSVFAAPGGNSDNNTFAVDGVNITDMRALGSSPTYYDFDSFEEIQVTTGGTDVSIMTPGVQMNMVTKRGTNEWRGSARYLVTDGDWQSDPEISSGDVGPGQDVATVERLANRIDEIDEGGAEFGFPVWKDHLWGWVYKSENDIKNLVPGATGLISDRTILRGEGFKINAQIGGSNSAVFSTGEGDKIKFGRNAGPTRPPETTWTQTGPTDITKLEDTHVFSSNFFLTGMVYEVDGGFQLIPNGGLDADIFRDSGGVWHGSYLQQVIQNDNSGYRLDGSVFFNAGASAHELKFGGGFREAEAATVLQFPRNRYSYSCVFAGCDLVGGPFGAETGFAIVWRDGDRNADTQYTSAWIQDTLTVGNLTANLGLRYDLQEGENTPGSAPSATIGGVTLIPGLDYAGAPAPFEWETVSPRLGLTYAVGPERKTLVRANYARYVEQLGTATITRLSPANYRYAYGYFRDANLNIIMDPSEAASFRQLRSNFNPASPFFDPDITDPNLDPSISDALSLGLEHAFLPEFVGSASVSYGVGSDILDNTPSPGGQRLVCVGGTGAAAVCTGGVIRVVERDDWVVGTTTPEGTPVFRLRPGVRNTGGFFLTNGDRETEVLSVNLAATKRLSNRWMLRGYVNWNDSSWDVPNSFFDHNDPNRYLDPENDNADGGPVVEQSAASGNKAGVWLQSEWTFNLNGLYQVAPDRPWGFNVGGNLTARQGYPNPEFRTVANPGDGIGRNIRLADVGDARNDDVYTLDLHIDKEFRWNQLGFTVSADMFNALNDNTVVSRERSRTSSRFRHINETISPRIARLGLRISFN